MGQEYSSPRRDEDGDTIASGWSYDRDKIKRSVSRSRRDGEESGPSSFIDAICGRMVFEDDDEDYSRGGKSGSGSKRRSKSTRRRERGSEEYSDDDDETYNSERPKDRERKGKSKLKPNRSLESEDYSFEEDSKRESGKVAFQKNNSLERASPTAATQNANSFDSNATPNNTAAPPVLGKPLASAFAKRCYFTKAGIGPLSQHYEGVTLTGNTVLMLASAMKLKGCPTICDEDLRRVEQTFPNQFSRLPDELLLSSGWRRISKHCHFSGKPIPDGMPFFHSKDRLHPQTGGYYFLVASSLGMERPDEVEPLTIDMLILLQTDFPDLCDQAPKQLLEDPNEWTMVTKFCFFSGGPINADEDVYYEAEFESNPICMLAFLSPNLTPEELYRLNDITGENALKSVAAVEEVDQVYNLTLRDFVDLKLYHLGPCRALPSFLLTPETWTKVLPIAFIECREKALARAFEFESHAQEAIAAAGKLIGNGSMNHAAQDENGYIEFHKGQEPNYPNPRDEIKFDEGQLINDENAELMNNIEENSPGRFQHEYSQYNDNQQIQGSRQSNNDSKSPMRSHATSPSVSPKRIGKELEEFPDPEVLMDELDEDEFPENDDIADIGPIVPPNDHRSNLDKFGNEREDGLDEDARYANEDQPMDEAMVYGMSNPNESYHELEAEMEGRSNYQSIGIGSKTPPENDNEDEMNFESKRDESASPSRNSSPSKNVSFRNDSKSPVRNRLEQSPSPKRQLSPIRTSGKGLELDAHVDEVIDVPDPSPRLDLVSPMSAVSQLGIMSPSTPSSPAGSYRSQNSYTKSSAMRGAQKLLKKNRQQRLAIMAKRRSSSSVVDNITSNDTPTNSTPNSDNENDAPGSKGTKTIYSRSRGRSVTPIRHLKSPPESPVIVKKALSPSNKKSPVPAPTSKVKMGMYKSASTRGNLNTSIENEGDDDAKSDATSAVSGTSSVWTDATDLTSKDSRRALILKMAKSRMKKKKGENAGSTGNN